MTSWAFAGKCGSRDTPTSSAPRAWSRPSSAPSAIAPRLTPERARKWRRLSCCATCSPSTALLLGDRLVQVQDDTGRRHAGRQLHGIDPGIGFPFPVADKAECRLLVGP